MREGRERWRVGLDLLPWALGRRALGLSAGIRDRDGAVCAKAGCAGSPLVWEGGPFKSFGNELGNKSE